MIMLLAWGAVGNSLFVATDGHPYRVQADVGATNENADKCFALLNLSPLSVAILVAVLSLHLLALCTLLLTVWYY